MSRPPHPRDHGDHRGAPSPGAPTTPALASPDREDAFEVLPAAKGLLGRRLVAPEAPPVRLEVGSGPPPAPGAVVLAAPAEGGPWRLREALAPAGSLRAALYRLGARENVPLGYPTEVHREVAAWREAPGVEDPGLEDQTHLPYVTIDNEDSRDLDQAMHIGREGAHLLVSYALADASYYVAPGSALFAEALARGASFYLPGLSLPMLPRALSEDLVSLNAGQRRRALVLRMRLDAQGECLETVITRARIRSVAKLSYHGVQTYYDRQGDHPLAGQAFSETLDLLREVGLRRIADARARHVLRYRRAELEVQPDASERLGFVMATEERNLASLCNEQISLLCNVEGAQLLWQRRGTPHVQPIFRNHPPPEPARLRELSDLVGALAKAHSLDPATWTWHPASEGGEPLADWLGGLPAEGAAARVARTLERQAMMAMERSSFEPVAHGHFGVGSPVYARFSSPMREIVGIFTHKEALEALHGPDPRFSDAADEQLREQVLEAGNQAKARQGRLTKAAHRLALDQWLAQDLEVPEAARPWRPGTVFGLRPSRLHVELDTPPVELKVDLDDLAAQYGVGYRLARDGSRLLPEGAAPTPAPTLRLGDAVALRLVRHDDDRRRFVFDVVPAEGIRP